MTKNAVYWFDYLFDADGQKTSAWESVERRLVSIEDLQYRQKIEDEKNSQPETYAEAYKQTHQTELPF